MGKIINLENYLTPYIKPALVSVVGVGLASGYLEHVLALIENTSQHRGFLLAESFTECSRGQLPGLHKAYYLRSGKRPYYSYFRDVYFQEREEFKICCTDRDYILPAPSREPYLVCGIEKEKYHRVLQLLSELKRREEKVIGEMTALLAQRVPLAIRREGFLWKKKRLVTPEGYADQIREWLELVERFQF